MESRRNRFRVTRRGKIVLAILLTTLITTIVIIIWKPLEVFFAHSSASTNSGINGVVGVEQQVDGTTDRVDFEDSNLTSIKRPYRPASNANTNTKTNTNAASNDKKDTSPEIDEEFFNKALFIGDSITEGISAYGFLNGVNVLGVKGLTILKAEKEIDTIVKRNPDKIYILLGSNDLLYGMDSKKFSSEYIDFIKHIKDKLPESKIYIQSIFPVSKDVENEKPMLSNSRIDEFNSELKSMADQQGISYINVEKLLKDDKGIINKDYTSDGIHIKYKVYSIWLDYVKKNS
jgi:hypothetical protein